VRSAGRKAEAVVRRHVALDLEHDLGTGREAQRTRVTAPTASVDVHRDRPTERREPTGSELLPPDTEQAAERPPALVPDDAARIERPDVCAAPRRDDPAEPSLRVLEPDRRRDDDDKPPCEELDVDTGPHPKRRPPADELRGRRPRGRVVARAYSHRCRDGSRNGRRGPDGEGAQVHRHQATRALFCLLTCVLVAGVAVPAAVADGDPASDYLVGQQVFLSYDAKIPPAAERKLVAAVASANRNGFPVRVALIWSSYDLGSVPELFGKPRTYARFLDAEDSKCWWGGSCGSGRFKTTTRLVVVMPSGLGFAQWKHDPTRGYRALAGIDVIRTPGGLADAATSAVVKLAAAAGVKVSTKGGSALVKERGGGGGTSRPEILAAVVAALLVGAGARLVVRRRTARSALR
jgi:hypothetical protein